MLNFRIDPISSFDLVRLSAEAIENGKQWIIANHNLHSIYLWYRESRLRQFYEAAEYVHIDGMSLILLANILGVPLKREHRTTYLDFLPLLLSKTAKEGWRIFYVGSKPNVGAQAAVKLQQIHPGLQICTHHGYFDAGRSSDDNKQLVAQINTYAPHILMVGMGMPRQELWILENRNDICANLILPAGAIMDYVAGAIPTPPRWLASIYLEWMYRLCSEPTRLWRRYLVEPWFVGAQILKYSISKRLLSGEKDSSVVQIEN